jgi:hypothetical protein
MPRHVANILTVFSALFLTACALALAPAGDADLVARLNGTNEKAQVFFAGLSGGSGPGEFPAKSGEYDQIEGALEALRMRAEARDVPALGLKLATRLPALSAIAECQEDPVACVNSSPASLAAAIATIRQMRETHRTAGIATDTAVLFKGQFNPAIAQALAIESLLIR